MKRLTNHIESQVHRKGCDWKRMAGQPIWPWCRRCDWWYSKRCWTFKSSLSSPKTTGHCATVLKNEQNHSLRCGSKWEIKSKIPRTWAVKVLLAFFITYVHEAGFLTLVITKTKFWSWLQPELASRCSLWNARSLKACATLSVTLIYSYFLNI